MKFSNGNITLLYKVFAYICLR